MDVKHFLRAFSFRLFFAVCALNVIGILAINSATNQSMAYVGRQATGMALGIAIIALPFPPAHAAAPLIKSTWPPTAENCL